MILFLQKGKKDSLLNYTQNRKYQNKIYKDMVSLDFWKLFNIAATMCCPTL